MSYISDLHTHIALKAANNENIKDIWEYKENKPPKNYLFFFNALRALALDKYYNTYATYTQCNLENCVDGQLRLVNCALYPIERQYIDRHNKFTWLLSSLSFFQKKFPFIQLFNKKRNLLVLMVRVMVGTSKKKAIAIWDNQKNLNNEVDYFKEYMIELNHLIDAHDVQPTNPKYADKAFRLVRNFEELKTNLSDPNVISGIVSLEGIHGLAKYKLNHLFKKRSILDLNQQEQTDFLQNLNLNLRRIKEKDFTPLYITIAHHYNNLLCGHVKSFNGFITLLFRQKRGMNGPLTEIAKTIIDNMLMRSDDLKRILIDIKHMSVTARKEYYDIIRKRNSNLMTDQLGIPIISSHSAVSAVKTLDEASKIGCDKKDDKHSYISRCDVNLCDEDIIEIYNSDGLIGVLMHEGRMPGKIFKKTIKKVKDNIPKRKMLQQQLFLTNVYHIVQVIEQDLGEDGWKIITLGSDLDGLIDPFDDYNDAGTLTAFRNDVFSYLKNYQSIPDGFKIKNVLANSDGSKEFTPDEINLLNHGRTISEVLNGIFYKNNEDFLSKYFTDDYLHGKSVQPLIT